MFNKRSVFFPFLALLVFVISVGCLCTGLTGGTPTAAPIPTQPPVQQPTQAPVIQPTAVPPTSEPVNNNNNNNNSSGGLKTFTDKNGFFAIEVPADWKYEHNDYEKYYLDTFTSPDGGAVVESIVYNDGTAFTGNDNGRFALQILNQLYSKTGKEGDIKVSDDKIMKDGSERLTWSSKEGQYSGISFFEVRNKYDFLMFTVDWGNAVQDQYFDTLNAVIESYRVP